MMLVRSPFALSLSIILIWAAAAPVLLAQAQQYEGKNIVNIQFDPVEQPLAPSDLNAILPLQRGQPLRLADVRYRLGHHQRFGYFSKTGLPWKAIFDISCNPKITSFLEDAAAGTLQPVSWIDPAFTNFNPLGFPVNDDHPPADIADGQDLVLAVYDALSVRDGFALPEDDTGTQATTAQTPSPDSAGQPRSVTPGKDKVNEPIDANHPGSAASGRRRNLGRRGCSATRQAPDREADRGEHPGAARCLGSGYAGSGYRPAELR